MSLSATADSSVADGQAAAYTHNGQTTHQQQQPIAVEPTKSSGDPRSYRCISLPNGLACLLIHDVDTDKAAAAMDVKVGHWSDPLQLPGLAHFLEHMLFLGTDKYPNEHEYNQFLNQHGGSSNAFTSSEDTNYFFDVRHEFLHPMLDRFAQFFLHPLFTPSATDREIQAVHNENSKNLLTDIWRQSQLIKHVAAVEHPFHKFGTGNQSTLRDEPKKLGIEVRAALLQFHQQNYSANRMKLVVLGKESLEVLQQWVMEAFSSIVNTQVSPPIFPPQPFTLNTSVSPLYHSYIQTVPIKDLRSLSLLFPLPPVTPLYHSKPTHLIGHLIGHESSGSVLSLLKSLSYGNALSAGLYENFSSFCLFSVSIELTEEGLLHLSEIISIIFAYIQLISTASTEEWLNVYEEEKAINQMNFTFKSKETPMNYVSHLAGDLQHYPPADVLVAGYCYDSFDEALIRQYLSYLSRDNVLIQVTSRVFAAECQQVEPWYQTQYNIKQWTTEELQRLREPATYSALHLPQKNDFIATDFTLKHEALAKQQNEQAAARSAKQNQPPEETPVKENGVETTELTTVAAAPSSSSSPVPPSPPILIATATDVGCDTWWKPDTTFLKPKANVMIKLLSPASYSSPRHAVLTSLYTRLLEDAVSEFSYNAEIAGLSYSLSSTPTGLQLSVSGYNHKLPVLIQSIVSMMKSLEIKEARFVLMKEQLYRALMNFSMEQPYQHAVYNQQMIVEPGLWHNTEKLAVITNIQVQDVRTFMSTLLEAAQVTVFVHGNMSAEEAKDISRMIHQTLAFTPLFSSQLPELRTIQLTSGVVYRYTVPVLNPADKNSALSIMYQLGADTISLQSHIDLFAQIIRDAVFNQLRTVEQLGYLVWSGITHHRGVVSFRLILQSGEHSATILEDRSEAFLSHFIDHTLTDLSSIEWQQHVSAVIAKKQEKDKNLSQETNRHWNEIVLHRYEFNRQLKEIHALQQITQADLIEFVKKYLCVKTGTRAKVSVQIVGNQIPAQVLPTQQEIEQALSEQGEEEVKEEEEEAGEAGETAESTAAPSSVAECEHGVQPMDTSRPPVPIDTAPVVQITDFVAFKRKMPLFPCFI